jgi:hypothetical protein
MRQFVTATVVLIGVGLAGAFVILGIAQVKGSANRAKCVNNLKQLGIGVHNYASTYEDRLPLAAIKNGKLPPEKRLSWTVNLAPYLESDTLYRDTDISASWDAPANAFLLGTNYRVFRCPSQGRETDALGRYTTPYVGVAGVGKDDAFHPGVFSFDRVIRFPEMMDLGATFLFLETSTSNGPWPAAGRPTLRSLDAAEPYFGIAGQFPSYHRGIGTIATTVDGSVMAIDASIDPRVFEEMATVKRARTGDPDGRVPE